MKLMCAVLLAGTFLLFFPSLQGTFMFDDRAIIQGNLHIQQVSDIPKLFTMNYWAGTSFEKEVLLYRPLVMTTFALDYAIWKDNPFGFRLMNVWWHALAVLLVFWVMDLLERQYLPAFTQGERRLAALAAAGAFAVHTIHTEAVNMIVGRTELMAACGVLAAFGLWVSGRERWALWPFVGALLCKESSAVLPALVVVHEWRGRSWRDLGKAFRRAWPLWLGVAGYLILRTLVLGGLVSSGQSGIFAIRDPEVRIWTAFTGLEKYIRLLVAPIQLSPDYPDYRLAFSAGDPRVMVSVLILAGMAVAWWGWRNSWAIGFFSLGWIVIALLPVSNLLVPVGAVIGERFLYLPSFGACALVGTAPLAVPVRWRKVAWGMVAVLLCWWAGLTWVRNGEWKNDETLWGTTLASYPHNVKAAYHMAGIAMAKKDYARARQFYQTCITVDPAYAWQPNRALRADVHTKLGQISHLEGRYDEAISEYRQAIELEPRLGQARYAIHLIEGLSLAGKGEYARAIEAYRLALVVQETAEAHYNMSVSLLKLSRYQEALAACESSLKLDDRFLLAHINKGNALTFLRRYREATQAYEAALKVDSNSEMARKNLETIRTYLGQRP